MQPRTLKITQTNRDNQHTGENSPVMKQENLLYAIKESFS